MTFKLRFFLISVAVFFNIVSAKAKQDEVKPVKPEVNHALQQDTVKPSINENTDSLSFSRQFRMRRITESRMPRVIKPFLPNSVGQNTWCIMANTIDSSSYFGETVANGMLGIVSSPCPLKSQYSVLAGVYDLYGRGDVSNFLKSYNLFDVDLWINGQLVKASACRNHKQSLDMKTAKLYGSFEWNGVALVEYVYCALRQLPHNAMMQVNIKSLIKEKLSISVISKLTQPEAFKDGRFEYALSRGINRLTASSTTPSGAQQVSASISVCFQDGKDFEERIKLISKNKDIASEAANKYPKVQRKVLGLDVQGIEFEKDIDSLSTFQFSVLASTISSAHLPDPRNESKRLNIYAFLEGPDRLSAKHEQAWNDIWQSDIMIEGDEGAQRWVRSMLYHLYAFSREKSPYSLSPMGLSGLGYNGHVFWDADIWMFPALLVMRPELALPMINYRFNRLEAAKKNAALHGYKGAMYPWESAESGMEETPVNALSGPFEHHVTACVALAAWNYYCVTQDLTWLKQKGYPIIMAAADFWVSRVEMNEDGSCSILNVVGADEYAENVDDNAYTNAAAWKNLEVATQAARVLKLEPNPDWAKVASKMVLLQFEDGVTQEYKGYKGQVIKQADVNLLTYPLGLITDKAQIIRDLNYYEPRVDQKKGPAMTHSVFAILYVKLGDAEKALNLFNQSYQPNQLPPFGVIAETRGSQNPYFLTAAGGTLQTVLMGFLGLEITPSGIVQSKSVFPGAWKSIKAIGVGKDRKTYQISR